MEKQAIFGKVPVGIIVIVGILFAIYGVQFIDKNLEQIIYRNLLLSAGGFENNQIYRFFSYSLLHIDSSHILMNSLWLLIFAVPFIQNFSYLRFMLILLAGIFIGGVGASYSLENNEVIIGISAGVSAVMAATLRFIIKVKYDFREQPMLYHILDRRYLFIIGLITIIDILNALFLNYFYGQSIGWQAHFLGGVTGGLLMSLPWFNKNALFREREI